MDLKKTDVSPETESWARSCSWDSHFLGQKINININIDINMNINMNTNNMNMNKNMNMSINMNMNMNMNISINMNMNMNISSSSSSSSNSNIHIHSHFIVIIIILILVLIISVAILAHAFWLKSCFSTNATLEAVRLWVATCKCATSVPGPTQSSDRCFVSSWLVDSRWAGHPWCGLARIARPRTGRPTSGAASAPPHGGRPVTQMTDTCEQVHVGAEKYDLAEMKAKLSTALAAKEALMIGPHSTDIANRLDQEILTLRRALTDQRPLGEQLAGIQGVIARSEKRLNLALAERKSAMEALQAKIVSTSKHGYDTTETKHAHKFPQEWDATGLHGGDCCQPDDGMDDANREDEDTYGTVDHSEKACV